MGRRPMMKNDDGSLGDGDMEKETGFLTGSDIEKELKLYRSGSAPPTVEGSLSAVNGLFGPGRGGTAFSGKNVNEFFSEEEIRSDRDDLSYYYSKVKLNPRLIPALVPQEDWRSSNRFNGGVGSSLGGVGDRMKINNGNRVQENGGRSPFLMPPGFSSQKEECEVDKESFSGLAEWGSDGPLIGLSGLGLGSKPKSYAEIFQNDIGRCTPVSSHPSRPTSRNAINENAEISGSVEAEIAHLRRQMTSPEHLRPNSNNECPPTYVAAVGGASLSRCNTPDPKLIARAPSPSLPPIGGGRNLNSEKRGVNSSVPFIGSVDIGAALSGMSLSANRMSDEEKHFPSKIEQQVNNLQNSLFNQHSYLKKKDSGYLHTPSAQSARKSYYESNNSSGGYLDHTNSHMMADRQVEHNKFGNSYWKGASPSILDGGVPLSSQYQYGEAINSAYQNYGSSGYTMFPSVMVNQFGNGTLPPLLDNIAAASAIQAQFADPSYLQYLMTANNPIINRNHFGNIDLELQRAYLGSMISPQRSQYGVSIGSKSTGLNHQGYYGNSAFGVDMSYHGSPLVSPDMRFNSGMRYNMNENFASSLLEEFKSNKARCFELSEIAGHVVEFSADQYGSRFIQQKLETATAKEKSMVYEEIFPQTLTLMTDVFGNYVIQKFFEHGMEDQIRELANKLYGNVLSLSLQMYGCRVIQKAIEVVDMDQKIEMVGELDGHVMRCVHDQNGNHVIQKCIECVPEEAIQYIITTFFDQAVKLSSHPYGCRVIQRVLEHCEDPNTQNKVMEEVLGSVSMLAQDQYGNYVIQHVLEHGKPHERSTIIKELAGNIVQMSQQKFASNVVEKCLTFGDPLERQLLVTEMLGTTDENEPLQAMMKDQFANYVVQKVLETCDDQQRELILTRIKIHLNTLKKFTYGKHIVARVEKLVAAGERRTANQSSHIP